jgi:hypothetical protein
VLLVMPLVLHTNFPVLLVMPLVLHTNFPVLLVTPLVLHTNFSTSQNYGLKGHVVYFHSITAITRKAMHI